MENKYYCTLLSDIVLNASLASEGNMETLDYIPGSNFLGIVAKKYATFGDDKYKVFHSGDVRFGNAYLVIDAKESYPVPYDMLMPKSKDDIETFLNHAADHSNGNIKDKQLKQQRVGYITNNGAYQKDLQNQFSLKSAYDLDKRRSKEGQMFGFRSLRKGQKFVFSVDCKDQNLLAKIEGLLTGTHYLGKSRTAEYGRVLISKLADSADFDHFETKDYILVYAKSNLCFIDNYGQPTFSPDQGYQRFLSV